MNTLNKKYASFAKENINKILEKLEKTRLEKDHRNYKTLADSLREVMNIFWRKYNLESEIGFKFFNELIDKLSKEIEEINKLQTLTLSYEQYKEFRDWTIAFDKVEWQLGRIVDYVKINSEKLHVNDIVKGI